MIINYDSPGQLCNRIWSLVPSIAYGLEHGEKVMAINFDEYAGDFDGLNNNRLVRFASHKTMKRILLSFKVRGYIQNGKSNVFRKLFGLNFVEGWSNRLGNAAMVKKQSDAIRKIFVLNSGITSPVDALFAGKDGYTVVGIHIRRGDYKEWLGGAYYYTDDEYICTLKDIEKEFEQKGEKVKFLLCSNEEINLSHYEEFDCFTVPGASGTQDLYALSKCDYIAGPPSSYSQWASFWGGVSVKFMMSADEKLTVSGFSKIVSFNTFENGQILNID